MSPGTTSTRSASSSASRVETTRSSWRIVTTRAPSDSNDWTSHAPRNPCAPVTSTEKPGEVEIGHAVGVGRTKSGPVEDLRRAMKAPAGRRVVTGIEAPDVRPRGPTLRRDEALELLAAIPREQQKAPKTVSQVDVD